MLLSLSHKFLFIANVKTASTSIEATLSPKAEVALSETRFGKHDGLSVISQRFSWVRRYVSYTDFFVFGVIRDPVDWVLSLYNSHTRPDFDGLPHSTRGLPFSQFLREGFEKRWQMRPQYLRFVDEHGRFRVNYLLDFKTLDKEFAAVCARLEVGYLTLRTRNVSPDVVSREQLTDADIDFIRDKYAADYALIGDRPRSL